jgi:hypothetical protein
MSHWKTKARLHLRQQFPVAGVATVTANTHGAASGGKSRHFLECDIARFHPEGQRQVK